MAQTLGDIVRFRGDRLFDGAVSINWFGTDPRRCRAASEAFVFHGPQYHGVQQDDVGTGHGHRLMDTATFAQALVRQCHGQEDQPFTLAIAGYGTGKSHLGLTLATLLSDPDGAPAASVLSALEAADEVIASEVQALLDESGKPCLVVALNGMQNFDLAAEISRQIDGSLKKRKLDTKPLEDLRPRFAQAASLIRMSNEGVVQELLDACELGTAQEVIAGLEQHDENVYSKVHAFLAARGMTIRALTGESVRDIIDVAVREYCGEKKPFRSLVVLFDEFGRYTEFATVRSQIAGSGALQDLFEAIQANSALACLVGFIQFELNAYVQRIAPEYRNEVLRYVTRYQAARRVYLSINLETLIANLLEKRQSKVLDSAFDTPEAHHESSKMMTNLLRWFPQIANHRLWNDAQQFHTVIRKGCWPLSPLSTWFLFYLASAGKHLQERSALSLLGDAILGNEARVMSEGTNWSLAPVDLWSDALQQELLNAEEAGDKGSIAHAFASVNARHGAQFPDGLRRLLRAVVIGSKMELQSASKASASEALAQLAGMRLGEAEGAIRLLQEEFNVLEWDDAFKEFTILGDAVPRTQFLSFVRQRVAASYDEAAKAKLFARKAADWCDLLGDLDCDFAEENRITTREWRYQGIRSNLDLLPMQVKLAADRWRVAFGVDEARGSAIFCYVEPSRDTVAVQSDVTKLLRAAAADAGVRALPILAILMCDEEGILGQALAELAVLDDSLNAEERSRFGNLVAAHREKMQQLINDQVESMIRKRHYATGLREELQAQRLSRAGTELFSKIYGSPIAFPFDGFSTAKGNAADTCQELTAELLAGKLDFDGVIAKPVKMKNRAVTVLQDSWAVFTRTGEVSKRPGHRVLKSISEKWDDALTSGDARLPVGEYLRQLCLPPYGANLASAGLFLGVYVAARFQKLLVLKDENQISVLQWIQEGLFKGKFIDENALRGVDLVLVGEVSSKWESLLDEWEQVDSHVGRRAFLERAAALRKTVPIPPTLAFREAHLREQAVQACQVIANMEGSEEAALSKIEHGEAKRDVATLAWGASSLLSIVEKMRAESPAWTDEQIATIQPHVDRARQAIIMHFHEWLTQQNPVANTPTGVGDFQHRMVRQTAHNIRHLGLADLADKVEARTALVVKHFEKLAEAGQLLRDVTSWLTLHGHAAENPRVALLRELRHVGEDFAARLQSMCEKVTSKSLNTGRIELSAFLGKLKETEAAAVTRATALWSTAVASLEDVGRLLADVESLQVVFEGVPTDAEDLLRMKVALRQYQTDYQRLANEDLEWPEFTRLAEQLKAQPSSTHEEDDLPWRRDTVIGQFTDAIARRRTAASLEWIEALESDFAGVASISAAEGTRLHSRAQKPPAVLTKSDLKRLEAVKVALESRLATLQVDWLVEKFRELPPLLQRRFLLAISEIGGLTSQQLSGGPEATE